MQTSNSFPSFEELVDRIWYFDSEVFAHDSLFVFISHKDRERVVFHNCPANDIQSFLNENNPILVGHNAKGYDKYILKFWLQGYTPEELKKVNDYIIQGGKGWDIPSEYVELPPIIDTMDCFPTRKSLKELEGNLRLNITETTVSFDSPTKWTKQEYEEVLYYCTCDVEALIPIFEKLLLRYKSKYIIAKICNEEPVYPLTLTDANLTAYLLGAEKNDYNDPYLYEYPDIVDKNKIDKKFLDYIDDKISHNDIEYKIDAPLLEIDNIEFQTGDGGGHGFRKDGVVIYNSIDTTLGCEDGDE